MSFDALTTGDLVRILASGAVLELDAGARTTGDLVRLAAAAKSGEGGVTFNSIGGRTTGDYVRIGSAGGGRAILKW